MRQSNDSNRIREKVADAYGRAIVRAPSSKSCCSGVSTETATAIEDYSKEDLPSLPPSAATSSFGCGNPLALSEVREGETVLDLGSGAGADVLLAARKVGPSGRVIGVDMTDEMVEAARANVAAAGTATVEVRKGIIEDLPVESASVDLVISNCVINLSPEKERVFSEIARVLKPGGRMLVSDIVAEDLPELVRENDRLYSACIAGAVSENQYVEGLQRAGMVGVEVRGRVVYDEGQLRALLGSATESGCCGDTIVPMDGGQIARTLTGKIRSIRVFARKPMD